MYQKILTESSEAPSNPDPTVNSTPKRPWKTLYIAVAAMVAVVIIVAALMIPPSAAVIPLNVNYTVGEQMIYDVTVTSWMEVPDSNVASLFGAASGNLTVDGELMTEVVDFDGEFYTLNQTMTMVFDEKPLTLSYIEKMNKTGYSTGFFNLGSQLSTNISMSNPYNVYLTQLLNDPEVKVGDTVNIPVSDLVGELGAEFNGDVSLTFEGVQELTVPAGTYKVFQINMLGENITYHTNAPIYDSTLTLNITLNMNGQTNIEFSTMRQIKCSMQETLSMHSSLINYTMNMSMNLDLREHIKP